MNDNYLNLEVRQISQQKKNLTRSDFGRCLQFYAEFKNKLLLSLQVANAEINAEDGQQSANKKSRFLFKKAAF